MQTASSRIWTRVNVSVSYNSNHYKQVLYNKQAITELSYIATGPQKKNKS